MNRRGCQSSYECDKQVAVRGMPLECAVTNATVPSVI